MFIFVPMALVNLDSVVLRLREGDHVGVLKKTVKGKFTIIMRLQNAFIRKNRRNRR